MTLFRRREKRGLRERLMAGLWPRIGWRGTARYYLLRLRRLPGTPARIALGVACGAVLAPSPFVGLHLIMAGALAWLLRANIPAAVLSALVVGNPWVLPLWFAFDYWLGRQLLGTTANSALPASLSLQDLVADPLGLLTPLLLGAALIGPVLAVITYFPTRLLISRHRARRAARRRQTLRVASQQTNEGAS
jgi:hypothetical protein